LPTPIVRVEHCERHVRPRERLAVEVVIPIRWRGRGVRQDAGMQEMAASLQQLSNLCDVSDRS
jgi:hypothetical protein